MAEISPKKEISSEALEKELIDKITVFSCEPERFILEPSGVKGAFQEYVVRAPKLACLKPELVRYDKVFTTIFMPHPGATCWLSKEGYLFCRPKEG
jgi:hypothetical protein